MMELGFRQHGPMPMHCDISQQSILPKTMYFMRTKHIEIDYHFVRDAWTKKGDFSLIQPSKQLADFLTIAASPQAQVFSNLCSKLGMIDIYAPA